MAEVDVDLVGKDNLSWAVKNSSKSLDDFDKAVLRLIEHENDLANDAIAKRHFEMMTEEQKKAFKATIDTADAELELIAAQEKLAAQNKQTSISVTDFNQALEIGNKIMQTGQEVYAQTIDVYRQYAQSVQDLSLISGQSAENTSRFIQVLDDYRIGADDAQTATKALTKQGLAPNIETLASLSDQYLAITDTQKRNEFVLKNLGKAGLEWNQILSQGSAAIRETAAAQSGALVMSQAMLVRAEKLRLSQDALNDSTEALKITIGEELTPALGELVDWLQKGADGWAEFFSDRQAYNRQEEATAEILKKQGLYLAGYSTDLTNLTAATKEQAQAAREQAAANIVSSDALENATKSVQDMSLSVEELAVIQKEYDDASAANSKSNMDMVASINSIQAAEDAYSQKLEDISGQRTEIENKLAELRRQGYWEFGDQIQGQLGKLDELKQKEADLAAERDKQTLQFISNLLLQRLEMDGLTTYEFNAFAEQQKAWGLWSESAVESAKKAWMEADKVVESIAAIPSTRTVAINVIYSEAGRNDYAGGGPAEGGGVIHAHAAGGSFLIPQKYGNEGFQMGNGDTASAGEVVTITPKGGAGGNDALMQAIMSTRVTAEDIARATVTALQRTGLI